MTILFIGGTVVGPAESRNMAIRVAGERVVEVGDLTQTPEDQVVDCSGLLLLPGGIETHTHLQLESMGTVTADDFATGTRAALAGGSTTVIDFATQFHGESLAEGLAHWHLKADGNAVSDYAFHMAFTQWRSELADELPTMVEHGVTSFKMYMAYRNNMMVDDDQIYAALKAARELGCVIGFHCENGYLIDSRVAEELRAGHTAAWYHQWTRPDEFEREAIDRLGVIAAQADAPVYVVHLSSAAGLGEVGRARSRGTQYVAETCPQYLVLDNAAYGPEPFDGMVDPTDEREARKALMSPPLRDKQNQEQLWTGLADGSIQFVGTDHCSFTLAQKEEFDSFNLVRNGGPGIELRLALLYSEGVALGRLSAERFVEVTSTNAAKYFGLYPRKGVLEPGSDADIVLFDPHASWTVRHDLLHDATDYTPYEGMALQGRVCDVYLRGRQVVRDGDPLPDLPAGAFLRCGTPDLQVR